MSADPLWQLDAVSLEPGRLYDVSLTVGRGVTAIIGWSGGGKTSLLNLLAGFEKPDRGQIVGTPRTAWVPASLGLWPHCTALEHLTITGVARSTANALLKAFDLDTKSGARPLELSPEDQSRLAVARALAIPADVLVLDEPLAGVAPPLLEKYWQAIRSHLAATKASLIFSTQVPETAIGEARHVICLRGGRLLHAGPMADLYAEPPDEELMTYLGPGNWLTPVEARRWLRLQSVKPVCLRPEEILLTPTESGPLRVEAVRYRGSCAEAELRHVPSNATRNFVHRPAKDELRPGGFVQLAALIGIVLALFVAGERFLPATNPPSPSSTAWAVSVSYRSTNAGLS